MLQHYECRLIQFLLHMSSGDCGECERVIGGNNNTLISRNATRFARFNTGWKPRSSLFPSLSTSKVKRCVSFLDVKTINYV